MRDFIKKEIEKAVKKLYPKGQFNFDVSADSGFGDYSSNAAMVLGVGKPREVAEKIKNELEKSKKIAKPVSKIEIAGPGFLNFTLSEEGLVEGLKGLNKKPKGRKKKIQVEFISANPTGELHIGHGRSAFYGDVLSNVLEAVGYKVEREYFINDSKESTQIKELGKTVLGKGTSYLTKNLKSKIKELAWNLPSSPPDIALAKSRRAGITGITGNDSRRHNSKPIQDSSEAGYLIAKEIQKDNQEFITKKLGIKFDKWFSEEEELREKKAFKKTLDLLGKKKLVYEKDGALWARTSKFGDDEDRVVLRSDGQGSVSYFLSDIAYHIDKFGRKYAKIIDIWGADHQGHVKRMMAVKKALGWKGDLEILISQMVTLKEGGEKKKLSKRKGVIVLLDDLIKEIGLDAARWFYLEKSLSTHMEFDMALAKERSRKNPVYYVQYACARMSSILKKAGVAKKATSSPRASIYKFLNDPTANPRVDEVAFLSAISDLQTELLRSAPVRNLIKKLIQFSEVVEDTANDYQAQRLTTYAHELASEFSQFYRDVKVIGSENEEELAALVALTRKVLASVLGLLGISAPEKM